MEERIELRCAGGPLLGVLVGGTAIEVKRGARLFEIDLFGTLALGAALVYWLDRRPAQALAVAPEPMEAKS